MTVTKVTVSLDPAVADRARQAVAAGRAKSVSSWLNDAAKAHVEHEDLEVVLTELLDEAGGPPSEDELSAAATRLTAADSQ
jgi:Arc/MetJ-type ribon-helix-helix transcriptional regulator